MNTLHGQRSYVHLLIPKILENMSELLKFPYLGDLDSFSVFVSVHLKSCSTQESYNCQKVGEALKNNIKKMKIV